MKIAGVSIQVNTNKTDGADFELVGNPSAFAILEALQLVHRSAFITGEKPTSTTIVITWDNGDDDKEEAKVIRTNDPL